MTDRAQDNADVLHHKVQDVMRDPHNPDFQTALTTEFNRIQHDGPNPNWSQIMKDFNRNEPVGPDKLAPMRLGADNNSIEFVKSLADKAYLSGGTSRPTPVPETVDIKVGSVGTTVNVGVHEAHDTQNFDEINVHRINIIEPDGKPRVIISNSQRLPGGIVAGKEYRHPGRESAKSGGVLFFNDDGDEAGGMGFSNSMKDGKPYAGTQLAFDQNQQDQTLALRYFESEGKRQAGLFVWDQSDLSLWPVVKLRDKMLRAKTQEERDALNKQIEAYDKKMGGGEQRFFGGKELGDAILKLSDKSGKPRLILKVSESGESSIDFLDSSGKVTKSITP